MAKQNLLWVNRDADNFKSREHVPAINAHVQQWKKTNAKTRYERARKLHSTVSRTHFPWQRRQEVDEPAYKHARKLLPEGLKSIGLDGVVLDSSYSSLAHSEEALAVQARQGLLPIEKILGPIWKGGHNTSPTSVCCVSPSTTSLDPFFRLPRDIPNRDKNLLHLYFTTMPRFVYGTHIHAKYCPIRETTTKEIAENALFMEWILLAAEIYLAVAKGVADRVSMFQRKSSIYGELGKMIANPALRTSNTTISVLAAASMAEARTGHLELARKHCVAIFHLLNSQGGPSALRKMIFNGIATRVIVSFVSIGAGHALFADYIKLLASLRCLKETLLAIQTWSRSFCLYDAVLRGSAGHDNKPLEGCIPAHRSSQKIQRYHRTRAEAFASDSVLHRFILPIFEAHDPIEQRCHAALLTVLVVVLFDLRNDYNNSIHFLEEMVLTVASGQVVDEEEPPPMKVLTVLYIATDCAERYESVGFGTRYNVLRSWLAVEVLELLELASDRGRLRILEALSNSLMGGDGNKEKYFIAEDEMTAICDEMRLAWLEKSDMGKL